MSREGLTEKQLHYTMSFIGGFLGAYAILSRCDVFGSAQTANLIHTVLGIAGGNFTGLAIRLGALLIYGAGIVTTVLIPRYTRWSLHWLSLFVDGAAMLLMGFMPAQMDNMAALYPVFFDTAFQWCSFQGGGGYASATIFSTNNLRQFVASSTAYLCGHEQKMKEKAQFFGFTLLSFHAGVLAGWPAYQFMGLKSSWFGFVPLAVAIWLAARESGLVGACGLPVLTGAQAGGKETC